MTEIIVSGKEFDNYLREHINNINTSLDETRAYIHGIFRGLLHADADLSKESITLVYANARASQDFSKFQGLADWIFLVRTSFPRSLKASEEYYDTVARCSYYRCYSILDRRLALYEELADRFTYFVNNITSIHDMAVHQTQTPKNNLHQNYRIIL